ncbi:MAG: hypothetical protein CL735_02765 [Chloroflexi bacterium]|nr:hypothetical protein [Chloroflexota bacterium]|tara:strand:+ start:23030 stop:24517 length:1488 start_codon:yes stop_codon:yes gene_type:complete
MIIRYVVVAIFVLGLLGSGVFLLQMGNDVDEVQFIESPSQSQPVVINEREDNPEPNQAGRQVVELPEDQEIIRTPEEQERIEKEALVEAEIEAQREERADALEERNARAREEALAEARAQAAADEEARRAEIEAARAAQREAIEARKREIQSCNLECLQERERAAEIEMCELAGGVAVEVGAGVDCTGLISLETSGITKKTEFMFPRDSCVDECRYEAPSIVQMVDKQYFMYVKRIGLDGFTDGFVLFTSLNGVDWVLESEDLCSCFGNATFANAFVTEDGVRIYYDLEIDSADGGTGIASAFSEDGKVFLDEGLIISPRKSVEDLSAVEASGLSGVKVIVTNGGYRMYLSETFLVGFALDEVTKIWGLSSENGIDWEWDEKFTLSYQENFEGVGKSTYVDSVREVEVVPFGNGKWLMFYTANSELFAARSDDGVSWTKIGSLDVKITDVTIISLGNYQYLIYGEEKKVPEEAGARIEATTVEGNWISSFKLTVN